MGILAPRSPRKRVFVCFWLGSLCAAGLLALHAPAAMAQPAADEQKREARRLANEGETFFKEGDYAKAVDRFRQADAHFHAPTLVIMEARSQERLGALLEARALYQKVAAEDLGPSPAPKFKAAQEEAKKQVEALDARIPSVVVVLTRAPAGARVAIDGVEVDPSRLGSPIQVNPGSRVITAAAAGAEERSITVKLGEGARERAELVFPEARLPAGVEARSAPPLSPPSLSPSPVSSVQSPSSSPPMAPRGGGLSGGAAGEPESTRSSAPAIVAFTVGGAGVVTGLVAGGIWLSKNADIRSQCAGDVCPAALQPDIDVTKATGRLAVAGFVIGAAGLGAGAVLMLVSPKSSGSGAAARLFIGPGSASVRGSF